MAGFIETYFSEYMYKKSVQKAILKEYAEPFCVWDTTKITNALARGGIYSLKKLRETPMEEISKIRNIGPKAMECIEQMKMDIELRCKQRDKAIEEDIKWKNKMKLL